MNFLELVTIVVDDSDRAIHFFVELLGFELVEDSPALTNRGHPKRWVVVRPPRAQTGIVLARAEGGFRWAQWVHKSLDVSASFSGSMTSTRSTTAWWPPASSS